MRLLFPAVCFAALCLTNSAFGQAPISYGGSYSETFDALPTAPGFQNLDGQWVNESTLAGWSRLIVSDGTPGVENRWRVDNGTAAGGCLYSYGAFGSTDRALGMVPSSNLVLIHISGRFINATSQTLNSVRIQFVGEQWRRGTAGPESLTFSYRMGVGDLNGTGWSANTALDFAVIHTNGSELGLNGNSPENRSFIEGIISGLNWAPGESLQFRWSAANHPDSDHGLAVDDLTVTAVPEPATLIALGLGAVGFVRRRRVVVNSL